MTTAESILQTIQSIFLNKIKTTFGTTGKNITISNTSVTPVDAVAFQVLSAAVVASYTDQGTPDTSLSAITLPVGLIIYGKITSITLTSGVVKAYGNINNAI